MSLVSGPGRGGSGVSTELSLSIDKHVKYIQDLDTRSRSELQYWLTEHLRLSGLYWALTCCYLLNHPDALPRQDVIDFVISCVHQSGGFGAAPGHDAHLLYTVSAVQVLTLLDGFDDLEKKLAGGKQKVAQYIAALQDPVTGAFAGDEWGERDTRFLYAGLNALSLLGFVSLINAELAVSHIQACANFDGGFGASPDAETHAAQVFTCVAALAILGRLDVVDRDKLGGWLSDRQGPSGGLNGRPEKLEDVCYSWWVASSLAMVDRLHWIDGRRLTEFILKCQDMDYGGLSDRPNDMVDVFHTFFGVAGLSLMGYPGLAEVDPVYAMPKTVTDRVLNR